MKQVLIQSGLHTAARATLKSIITWEWTKKLLYWLIISAGTMSECVFLLASLWMSINSSVHPLVLLFMNEETTKHVSELATAAYVALPECILALAFVTFISHLRVWLYCKSIGSGIWTILYGLPTLVFLVLSLITLGCSVASTSFIMPEPLIIIRALAGYMFAFTSLLYMQLGVPQERDKLEQKDTTLAELKEENAATLAELTKQKDDIIAQLRADHTSDMQRLARQVTTLNENIDDLNRQIIESKNYQTELIKAVNKSSDAALAAYSEECATWLRSDHKTVSIEDITRYTGHSKRKIEAAINKGLLTTATRNKELITVSTLANWLQNTPPPDRVKDGNTGPLLKLVNN